MTEANKLRPSTPSSTAAAWRRGRWRRRRRRPPSQQVAAAVVVASQCVHCSGQDVAASVVVLHPLAGNPPCPHPDSDLRAAVGSRRPDCPDDQLLLRPAAEPLVQVAIQRAAGGAALPEEKVLLSTSPAEPLCWRRTAIHAGYASMVWAPMVCSRAGWRTCRAAVSTSPAEPPRFAGPLLVHGDRQGGAVNGNCWHLEVRRNQARARGRRNSPT